MTDREKKDRACYDARFKESGIDVSPRGVYSVGLETWFAAIKYAKAFLAEPVETETGGIDLENLSVDDMPEHFKEWHKAYFAIVELYAHVCPGWATDGSVRHMVGNIRSRLNPEPVQSDDVLREIMRDVLYQEATHDHHKGKAFIDFPFVVKYFEAVSEAFISKHGGSDGTA